MIRLDHFVIHVDPDMRHLLELKKTLAARGYPFEPTWGKGTREFQVANLWVGNQYLELVWLKRSDCRGWVPEWVDKYNQGHRGITAIMLLTDEIEQVRTGLLSRGLRIDQLERTSFRFFFGLLRKTLPWRYAQAVSTADQIALHLAEGTRLVVERTASSGVEVELQATTGRAELAGPCCQIENVRLVTTLH